MVFCHNFITEFFARFPYYVPRPHSDLSSEIMIMTYQLSTSDSVLIFLTVKNWKDYDWERFLSVIHVYFFKFWENKLYEHLIKWFLLLGTFSFLSTSSKSTWKSSGCQHVTSVQLRQSVFCVLFLPVFLKYMVLWKPWNCRYIPFK